MQYYKKLISFKAVTNSRGNETVNLNWDLKSQKKLIIPLLKFSSCV